MSFDSRIGIAGLIVALVGIGVTLLFPTKRWIGYACFATAALLGVMWGYREYHPFKSDNPAPVPQGGFLQFAEPALVNGTIELRAGSRLAFNTAYENKGVSPVHNAIQSTMLIMLWRGSVEEKDTLARKQFSQSLRTAPFFSGSDIGVGGKLWGTAETTPFTEPLIKELLSSDLTIYIVGRAQWDNSRFDVCQWMQKPLSRVLVQGTIVWHPCGRESPLPTG